MDTPTNLSFVWLWAVVALPLPWLIAGWLKKYSQGAFSHKTNAAKGALQLPVFYLPLATTAKTTATHAPRLMNKFSWQGMVWALLVLALMRPEWQQAEIEVPYKSRQLLLLVDISGSMKERMQGRTRLDQVKQVVQDFIQQRPRDHLGLVVFGGEAYLYVPRTLDHDLLIQQLQSLEPGMAGQGTAIGDALGVGVYNLLQAEGQPALLLLTDGANNAGQLKPEEALAMAKAANIPTHLIVVDLAIEPELSNAIKQTGGQVFSADSQEELSQIYQLIHQLEPQTQVRYLRPSLPLAFIPLLLALVLATCKTPLIKAVFLKIRQLLKIKRFLKRRSVDD